VATTQTAIAEARNSLKVAKYTGDKDNFKFNDYCMKIETAQNELTRLKVPVDGPSQVIGFIQGIKREDFQGMKAGIMSNPDTASDLGAAIKAMKKHEINRCHHITLTSEELWSPYSESFTVSENSYLPPHHRTSNATSSREHRSSVPAEILAPRWGTSLDIATRTLTVTTHHGIQNILSPLTRRFRTRQAQLRYPHLRTDVYSDTLFSDTKLSRGFTCGQLFVTDQDYADVFPMRSKSEAPYKLDMVCKTHGLP
jgi:hypothetical protein